MWTVAIQLLKLVHFGHKGWRDSRHLAVVSCDKDDADLAKSDFPVGVLFGHPELKVKTVPVEVGGSLSGILCLRHSMSKRSIYANESEGRYGGPGKSDGLIANDPGLSSFVPLTNTKKVELPDR